MAHDELILDVADATSAARALGEAGDGLQAARDAAGGPIDSAHDSRPWGRDELGDAFARGYADAAGNVLAVWRDVAQRTSQLGEEIGVAVRAVLESDRITSEVIDNAHLPREP